MAAPLPSLWPQIPPDGSAARLFDALARAEPLPKVSVVARPGALRPENLLPGDVLIQRALGEGRLATPQVLRTGNPIEVGRTALFEAFSPDRPLSQPSPFACLPPAGGRLGLHKAIVRPAAAISGLFVAPPTPAPWVSTPSCAPNPATCLPATVLPRAAADPEAALATALTAAGLSTAQQPPSPIHPAAEAALVRLAQRSAADRALAEQLRAAALHSHQPAGNLPADGPRVASLASRHGARMQDLLGRAGARLLDREAPPTLIFHPSLGAPSSRDALAGALAEAGRSIGRPTQAEDETSLRCSVGWSPGGARGPSPARPSGAKGARALLADRRSKKAATAAERPRREEMFIEQVLIGNVPDWMGDLTTLSLEVPHKGRVLRGVVQRLPDYLCIGSNSDFLHIPFDQLASQVIADKLGLSVPTARVCHALYQHLRRTRPKRCLDAITRDDSLPDSKRGADTPKGVAQTATDATIEHSEAIQARQRSRGLRNGTVVAGHKKDVTLSSRLHEDPNRIAFLGFYSAATHLPFEPCQEPSNAETPTCQADVPALAHRNEGAPRTMPRACAG